MEPLSDAPPGILVIEDNEADFMLLERHFRRAGLIARCRRVCDYGGLERALSECRWSILLCDYRVPGMDLPEILARLAKADPELPVILVSGNDGRPGDRPGRGHPSFRRHQAGQDISERKRAEQAVREREMQIGE